MDNEKPITGWERENRTHFDDIVLDYDRLRPEYPGALFEDAIAYTGPGKKALEIGAGTGKATGPFLAAGFAVTAVEPGENMAAFLLEKYRGENLSAVTSAFEDAPLDDDSYDLIYAASAFHWVDANLGCPKVFRLLKHGGALALMRYNVNPAGNGALGEEIRALYDRHYFSFYESRKWLREETEFDYWSPAGIKRGYGFEGMGAYGFADITKKQYDTIRSFGAEEYIAWLGTMSDHRSLPEGNRNALFAGIKDAINRHGGQYRMSIMFQLYMGRKR